MLLRRRPPTSPTWSPQRMRALVVTVAAAALVFLLGLALAIVYALRPSHPHATSGTGHRSADTTTSPSAATGRSDAETEQRDAIANAPMAHVDPEAAQPAAVSLRDPGTLNLPATTKAGPAGVPTGFPKTAAGALAQLAAIDQSAMQSGSLSGVRAVIAAWALPGGPTPQTWSGVTAMADFLDAAGLSGGGSGQLALAVTPLMGLIKGQAGEGFVVPCVDFEVDVTLAQTSRTAAADCQRMVWSGYRWMIGPGAEPSTAPSVWPDTALAIQVGYHDLRGASRG